MTVKIRHFPNFLDFLTTLYEKVFKIPVDETKNALLASFNHNSVKELKF